MLKARLFIFLTSIGFLLLGQQPKTNAQTLKLPIYTYEIVKRYPHDPSAFTEGLVYDHGQLYESSGQYGKSDVRRVALNTGRVLEKKVLAQDVFAEGLTLMNGKLYQLTWKNEKGFVWQLPGFKASGEFKYSGEGWGLTHDGENFIQSDGSASLSFYNPKDYSNVRRILVFSTEGGLVRNLNELEWVDGEIWANIWLSDQIARINPKNGVVNAWIDLSGLRPNNLMNNSDAVLNGIAYDAKTKRIFVTGKYWPYLYEIKLVLKK